MTGSHLRGKAAIVGASTGFISGAGTLSPMDMMAVVANVALREAGLTLRELDGLLVGMQSEFLSTLAFGAYSGITPRLADNNRVGGSSILTHTEIAALALDAGL